MKKLIIFLIIIRSSFAYAQSKNDNLNINKNSVYIEFFGSSGLFYNLTYERLFYKNEYCGLTGAIGFQYFNLHNKENLPFKGGSIQLNLISIHHSEIGIGFLFFSNGYKFAPIPVFPLRLGYRYQQKNGGFLFKIAFTPLIIKGNFFEQNGILVIPWAGVAFGYTF